MEGSCKYCTKSISKKESLHHFLECGPRVQVFEKINQKLFNDWLYIRADSSVYWIDILISKQWKLDDLDHFLRDIWLECCGHLSHFQIDNINYERFEDEDWLIEGEELSPGMEISLNKVLGRTTEFSHIYDYGSTTELNLKVLDEMRYPVKKQIFLCAQNHPPMYKCMNCNTTASQICVICHKYSCEKCIQLNIKNTCYDYEHSFLPLVNSPRTGVCGYDGTEDGI